MSTRRLNPISYAVAASLLGVSSAALASAFQLFEGNAASVTNFGAGGAAIAEDASTSFYNPAGLTRLNEQLVLSLVGVSFDTKFTGMTKWSDPSGLFPPVPFTGSAKGGTFSPVPAIHFAKPINDRLTAGLSLTAPFGLSTDYDTDSFVRYAATKTKLVTIDLSPAFGYKVSDTVAVGVGLDVEYAQVEFDSVGGLPFSTPATEYDTTSSNNGHDTSVGWHGGVLFNWNKDATRVGFNFQSQVNHTLKGRSTLSGPLANSFSGGDQISDDLRGKIHLPSTSTLSVYHTIDPTWSVMGSAIFTNWSVFKKIQLENIAGVNVQGKADNSIVATTEANYRDTWRFVAGVDHHYSSNLLLRAGVGYDQSPVNDHDRDLRLPDGDRIALSAGFSYKFSPNVAFELGYTHLFVRDQNINNSIANGNPVTTGTDPGSTLVSQSVDVIGRSRTSADLVGAQLKFHLS